MAERHRAEIEAKKAKLAELRRARDERAALLAQPEKTIEPAATSRKDVNDLVDSLLQRPTTPYASSSRHASGAGGVPPTPARASSRAEINTGAVRTGRATPPTSGRSLSGTPAPGGGRVSRMSDGSGAGAGIDREMMISPFPISAIDYVDHSAELYELPSKPAAKPPPVTYSKAIQTSVSTSTSTDPMSDDEDDRRTKAQMSGRETEEEMRKRIIEELDTERKALEKELAEMKAQEDKVSDLSQEQKQAIFAAPDFSAFIEESTKIVQRALSDNYDYIKDYTIGLDGAFDDAEGSRVKLVCAFSDERWTEGRSITDLDWSPKFPELVVASYNKNPTAPNDPDGIVAVWNLHLQERPEFVFHSPSDVLSVTFSPYHPTLIFGGSYSGQILLWDTRAKHLPVLKTPLSANGHTYPIYAMKMIGTQNANNLISSSTDGLVCSWQADMLAQPQETLHLTAPSTSKTDEVSITCFDFPNSETSTFWIGTEEGSVHQSNRYDRATTKAGLDPHEIYKSHGGPITGIHFHPGTGSIDFSDLFLTSSVDWTVKLWRAKINKATTAATGSSSGVGTGSGTGTGIGMRGEEKGNIILPIHSFEESDDYVFDVRWHPSHPAVFGSVDGNGKFDLWNINSDSEVPIISTQVSPRALNKLAWDRTPLSRKVGMGGADGKLYVYDVAEKVVSPRDSEWLEMQKTVQGLSTRDVGLGLVGGGVGGNRDRAGYGAR